MHSLLHWKHRACWSESGIATWRAVLLHPFPAKDSAVDSCNLIGPIGIEYRRKNRLKEADAAGVTQDYVAEPDRPQNKVLFARDVLADLIGVKDSEGGSLDGALDSYEVTESSIQAVYAAKIGTSQERLAKVRGDYGIRQKAALEKLTPNLRRNVVKKVITIRLGLDFLLSKTSNNKFVGPHVFQPALWKELHDQYGNAPSRLEADVALIVIPS
jgi:hypothetical protein